MPTDRRPTDRRPTRPAVIWFRRDLRLDDNPAWAAATRSHEDVVALFVLDSVLLERSGSARRALLFAHLHSLDHELRTLGGHLTVRSAGPGVTVAEAVGRVMTECGADELHVNRDAAPYATRRDAAAERTVTTHGLPMIVHDGNTVQPPGSVLTAKGTLSRVFSPFHRAWDAAPLPAHPQPAPARLHALPSDPIPDVGVPFEAPAAGWRAGSAAAWDRLNHWLDRVDDYPETRDLPAVDGTSTLSIDLKFGSIGPRTVLDVVGRATQGRRAFVRQLAWRDWWFHLLVDQPTLPGRAVRPEYDRIPWRDDPVAFEAWCEGRTGYPIVDAGMRQLNATGWIHNRVRMITASFLVKDLLIDWRLGERYFRRRLLDADLAQNVGNWQWVAGTGPDAAPYFRIFNPSTQAQKFDPLGDYVRRWIPELAAIPGRAIHRPGELGPRERAAAGAVVGRDYPSPIVDHVEARNRTLAAYKLALTQSA